MALDNNESHFKSIDGLLWRVGDKESIQVKQLIVLSSFKGKILKLVHDTLFSGHQGCI